MDVNYINPFLVAVQNVFDTMIDVPLKLGKPTIKRDSVVPHEISAIIGLSGSVSGSVVISLSQTLALDLASSLIGETFETVDDDCTDAIGEIANMIAGNAKTDFPGEEASISVPSVVIGKHKVSYPSGIPIIAIPCAVGGGELVIEIAIKLRE